MFALSIYGESTYIGTTTVLLLVALVRSAHVWNSYTLGIWINWFGSLYVTAWVCSLDDWILVISMVDKRRYQPRMASLTYCYIFRGFLIVLHSFIASLIVIRSFSGSSYPVDELNQYGHTCGRGRLVHAVRRITWVTWWISSLPWGGVEVNPVAVRRNNWAQRPFTVLPRDSIRFQRRLYGTHLGEYKSRRNLRSWTAVSINHRSQTNRTARMWYEETQYSSSLVHVWIRSILIHSAY